MVCGVGGSGAGSGVGSPRSHAVSHMTATAAIRRDLNHAIAAGETKESIFIAARMMG